MNRNYLFIVVLVFSAYVIQAQKITVTGGWNVSINSSAVSDAGNNLTSTVLSPTNATIIDVDVVPKSSYNRQYKPQRVLVQKADNVWNTDLVLWCKRTVTTQNANISLGTSFQQITNNAVLFFNTVGEQFNIPIQYQLTGISLLVPATNYNTSIIYTVLDN